LELYNFFLEFVPNGWLIVTSMVGQYLVGQIGSTSEGASLTMMGGLIWMFRFRARLDSTESSLGIDPTRNVALFYTVEQQQQQF